MKLKNIVIVVKDVERSKQFYKELFGLDVILDQEGNAILTEGLVLQESKVLSLIHIYWSALGQPDL